MSFDLVEIYYKLGRLNSVLLLKTSLLNHCFVDEEIKYGRLKLHNILCVDYKTLVHSKVWEIYYYN
jgi:hypothetical protein